MLRRLFSLILVALVLMAPMAVAEELPEFTYVKCYGQSTLDEMINSGVDFTTSPWTELFAEELGIDVKLEWTVPTADEYASKLGITIANGEIPDLIVTNGTGSVDFNLIKNLYEYDMLADLTDVFEQYASEDLKAYMAAAGKEAFYPVTFEGRLMGLPQVIGSENQSDAFIWLRQDWLDNLGLAAPETMEDLINIIKAFKDNDPDGNGEADTIGLYGNNTVADIFRGFFNGYHAYPGIWVDDGNGGLAYGSIQPEIKEALAALAELYAGGYLHQEFYALDTLSANEAIANSKCGAIFGKQWYGIDMLQNCYNNDPKAEWVAFNLVSVDDEPARPQTGLNCSRFYVVSKDCEHPEYLIQMFNLYIEKIWTGTQEDYGKYGNNADGYEVWTWAPIGIEPVGKNYNINAKPIKEAIDSGDDSAIVSAEQKMVWDYINNWRLDKDVAFHGWYSIYGGAHASNYKMGQYIENELFMYNGFVTSPTEGMSMYQTALDTMEDEAITQIITGQQPLEYFDTFVENWLASGGSAITEEVNEWYAGL